MAKDSSDVADVADHMPSRCEELQQILSFSVTWTEAVDFSMKYNGNSKKRMVRMAMEDALQGQVI